MSDEVRQGTIDFHIGVKDGKVGMEFSEPVKFLLFHPEQARVIAEEIRKASYRADEEAKRKGETSGKGGG